MDDEDEDTEDVSSEESSTESGRLLKLLPVLFIPPLGTGATLTRGELNLCVFCWPGRITGLMADFTIRGFVATVGFVTVDRVLKDGVALTVGALTRLLDGDRLGRLEAATALEGGEGVTRLFKTGEWIERLLVWRDTSLGS